VTEQLGRRCALVMLAALMLAAAVGLLAWGPVTLGAAEHQYADRRIWLGLPNAFNMLVNLPLLAAGLWGWRATPRSTWPQELRRPLQVFHLCVMGSATLAAIYHAGPGNTGYLLSQVAMSAACVMLSVGMLAERVDARFGSARGMTAAAVSIIAIAALISFGVVSTGTVDLRPLLLVQLLPVLLVPAGAPSLPGRHTRRSDWMLLLAAYAASRLFDLGDTMIFRATGWLGGHALTHLSLAGVAGWMAYCAARAPAAASDDVPSRRHSSLNTAS
jgi:putative effector of murein hydrolase LrgA (UPF0299 family)